MKVNGPEGVGLWTSAWKCNFLSRPAPCGWRLAGLMQALLRNWHSEFFLSFVETKEV